MNDARSLRSALCARSAGEASRSKTGFRVGMVIAAYAASVSACFCGCLSASCSSGSAFASDQAMLHWVAGDSLPGSLLSADQQSITWKSPLFVDPLQIDARVLSMVELPKPEQAASAIEDSLKISLANGDVLYGNLIEVNGDVFRFQCSRYGTIDLRRDQIQILRRIDSPGLVFLGPQGLAGWKHPLFAQWTEPPGWKELGDGRLTTSKSEAVMFRPTEFPTQCEIELVLSSSERPSFVMSLGSNTENSLRLETWDNALVAMSQDDFVSVDTIGNAQRKVHLFLFVDFPARRMTVFSDSGRQLAEITGNNGEFGTPGVLLRNGERDLTLEYLSVANWDGSPFQGVQSEKSRVHTADGKVVYGQIVAVDVEQQAIRVSDGTTTEAIRLSDIRGLIVNENSRRGTQDQPAQIMFHNGELISGSIRELNEGRIRVQTMHAEEELVGSLDGVSLIRLSGTVRPPAEPDRMYFPEGSLRGTLMVDDHAQQPIRWKPMGGLNASALSSGGRARFVRGAQAASVAVDTIAFPDVVYLTNNDVIPCRLLSCQQESIRIESPFCEVQEIPSSDIRAVELQQPFQRGRRGFGDPGWRRVVGTPSIEADRLRFKASEAVGHASIMSGDVMQFKLSWSENLSAALTLHLNTQLPSSMPTGTAISFGCRGESLVVYDGSQRANAVGAVGMGMGGIAAGGIAARPGGEISVPQRSADVTIFRQGDRIRVSVDGQLAGTFHAPRSAGEARGLLIRANVIHVRTQAPAADPQRRDPRTARQRVFGGGQPANAGDQPEWAMQISDFEMRDVVGESIRQFVDEEAREAVLTVPRFRRDFPPTHVLLAPNGDLLRGRLISADHQGVVFESRLERIRLERERVVAIIWLKTGEEEGASQGPHDVQIVMDRGIFLTMNPAEIRDGQLLGQSARLGQCAVPASGIRELSVGHWDAGSQTASYTLWIPRFTEDPKWDMPQDSGGSPAAQMVGEVAPGIQLPTLDGGLFRLPDHRDKIVVLDFWATWCGPCVQALPAYINVTSQFDSSQVMFIAVNLEETPQTVRTFLKQRQLAPIVAMDRTGIVGAEFNVSGIPHSVIIGPDNRIEHVRIGYRAGAEAEMQQIIQQILDGTWQRPAIHED